MPMAISASSVPDADRPQQIAAMRLVNRGARRWAERNPKFNGADPANASR